MPPWEIFRMRSTPRISVSPTDSRKRTAANTKPSSTMMVNMAMSTLLPPSLPLPLEGEGQGGGDLFQRLQPVGGLHPRRWHDLLCRHFLDLVHDGKAVFRGEFAQADD